MNQHSHDFIKTYDGLVGFGLNRETDENTIKYYLQKFSDDAFMEAVIQRFSQEDLEKIFQLLTRLLKEYLTEPEYHRLFLKDSTPEDESGDA